MTLSLFTILSLIAFGQQRGDLKLNLSNYSNQKLQIKYGDNIYALKRRNSASHKNQLSVYYKCPQLPWIDFYVNTSLKDSLNHKMLIHEIGISSSQKLTEDLTFYFPVFSIKNSDEVWLPLKNGTGKTILDHSTNTKASFRCAGSPVHMENDLAIPLSLFTIRKNKVAVMTDPEFSSIFDNDIIYWTYPKEVGLEDKIEKRVIAEVSDIINPDDAINMYYKTLLKDIPIGPAWTKDIAMVSYDYMSDDGQGWYHDIDSLIKYVSFTDRKKILLTLHGWYDYVGRYCFNSKTGKLDNEWRSPLTKKNINLEDLHQRLQYAKDKGFKVAMYFADGIISSDKLDDYSPNKAFKGGGWNGPDVLGKSYRRNIAVPEYYHFYLNYATALFNEFGKEADLFVWDETYYIKAGNLGTPKYPSYLDRRFMHLVKEITAKLHKVNPGAAFMTSDLVGPDGTGYGGRGNDNYSDVPPYALFADGTYQDSHCLPMFWSYGIFPNYRNVVWSCNWTPVSKFDYTLFGVLQYQAPAVFTNGWGDNIGFSEMDQKGKDNLIELFNYRKSFSTRLKWLKALPPFINTCDPHPSDIRK